MAIKNKSDYWGTRGLGTAASDWTNTYTTTSSNAYSGTITIDNIQPSDKTAMINGDLDVTGDIKVDGEKLSDKLSRIEHELSLPDVIKDHPERRRKHATLQKIYDEYMREEEKLKMWERLKGERDD